MWAETQMPTASNKRRTFVQDPDEAMQERIKRLRIASSEPFDPSSSSFGAASSSSPTDVPHPGLARAWANSAGRGQPAVWPPASAGQPPNMHPGHPGTPTAQHPFVHHPFGAGAGCGYSPHTQELHGHALAAVNTGGAMFHPAGSAASSVGFLQQGSYSGVNSMLGQLHAERVAAGVRGSWHEGEPYDQEDDL